MDGLSNGEHEVLSEDGPSSASKESAKTTEGFASTEPKPPKVLEALSASGLRALRYAREIEGIGQVVALDNDIGISLCLIWYFLTAYLDTYLCSSSSSGALDLKQTCMIYMFLSLTEEHLVQMSCFGPNVHFRTSMLVFILSSLVLLQFYGLIF